MNEGIAKAWEDLWALNAADVCARTGAVIEQDGYRLNFYGQPVKVWPSRREITTESEVAQALLGRLGYFAGLSLISYLVHATTNLPTGRLIKPTELRGMENYFTASHSLPLEGIANRYGRDGTAFIDQGRRLGGDIVPHGDAAVRLLPMPGFPVVLILWIQDDEFPARADLLLDAICPQQAPIDIIWSISMLSVLAMQM